MSYASRLLPTAIAACLLLGGCVFTVDHEMESDDEQPNEKPNDKPNDKPNGEEPDPDVSIAGPDETLYVDGDDFSVDYAITCEPEGCEDDLRCAVVQGDAAPDFAPCSPDFTVTSDDVDEGEYTVEVELTDGEDILATDSHTAVVLVEFQLSIDGLDPDEPAPFFLPELGDYSVACSRADCELTACTWDDDIDPDYNPDICTLDDPLVLELPSGTADARLTVTACVDPDHPADGVDHCLQATYDFEYTDPVWTDVSTGEFHTCGILEDHSLWCWGWGDDGRLGVGDDVDRNYPAEPVEGTWRQVSVGARHTCAIDLDGQLYCWGDNATQQAAPQASDDVITTPEHFEFYDYTWKTVSAGYNHTCAIADVDDEDLEGSYHDLFCWGADVHNQLGEGHNEMARQYVKHPDGVTAWDDVAASAFHTCGIARTDDDERDVYCWGTKEKGLLGNGEAVESTTPEAQKLDSALFDDDDAAAVTVGFGHSCAIADDGNRSLHCWGGAKDGRLGNGDTDGSRHTPASVTTEPDFNPFVDIAAVSAGHDHSCAITDDGDAYCWGLRWDGRLGTMDADTEQAHPIAVDWSETAAEPPVVDTVSAGHYHTCAITDVGRLYCWGADNGALGTSEPDEQFPVPDPTPVFWPFAPE